jgi:hypothetical protein
MDERLREAGLKAPAAPARERRILLIVGAVAVGIFLLAVFLPMMLRRPGSAPGDEIRDTTGVTIQSLLDETAVMPRDAVLLRWSRAPGGSRYAVELTDENLEVLHRVEGLDRSWYEVPPDALATRPSSGTVYWRVEATLPDGTEVSSNVFVLKLQ